MALVIPTAGQYDYDGLQTLVSQWMHREGDTELEENIPSFIALTESVFQAELKLLEFEATGSIIVTNGVGPLPSDYVGMRSIYWNGDYTQEMRYVTPSQFDSMRNADWGEQYFYTISGATLRVLGVATGVAYTTYNARFVNLSDTNPSNAILNNFPDVYLWGGLAHGYLWAQDDEQAAKYGSLFQNGIDRINDNNQDRKYGGPLQVRAG